MSDSMERDKTELMIRKEKEEEEEEMKRELEAMQMYESWYTYTDMKQILGAINESRDMANMTNDERKKLTHCSNNWIPEATSKSQTQELEAQDHNDASQSMHSYRIIRTSPVHERVPCQGCSTSNVASTVDDFGNPAFRRKFLDNEDTSIHRSQDNSNTRDCYYHTPNRSLSLKLKNTLQDSDATNNPEAAAETMDENCEPERTLERWQINPLDSCVNENDVPLPEPNRPLAEDRMPFRLCKDARTTEELEKLLPVLNHHLKQTAEPWRSRRHAATDDKFQWGSPIQVGTSSVQSISCRSYH